MAWTSMLGCSDLRAEWQASGAFYAVGARAAGVVEACGDQPVFAWASKTYDRVGVVRVPSGTWMDARAWWLKHHPLGKLSGPIWGYYDEPDEDPFVPALSLSQLRELAATPNYKTLLRNVESYDDRLVRLRGKVFIVDGDDAYVHVTPVGYGLYKDAVHVDTRYLTTRLVPDDMVDIVGLGNGTVQLVGDIPDVTALRATVR